MVNIDYYMPSEYEDGIQMPKLSNGEYDLISALYSNESLTNLNGDKDYENIITSLNQYQQSNRLSQQNVDYNTFTDQIKLLAPEGLRDILSLNTNVPSKLCIGTKDNTSASFCEFPF